MHPIEHLRYVARSGSVEAQTLVNETVIALASLGAEPADLLISSRRLLQRHPGVGALWAAMSRLVTAADLGPVAWDLVETERVDIEQVAAHLPADSVVVPSVEWLHESVAHAAQPDRAAAEFAADFDAVPVVRVLDHGDVDLAVRRLLRCHVDPLVVSLGELEPSDRLVFEPLAVAPGLVVAAESTAVLVGEATAADHEVWAVAPGSELLPAAYGDEIVRRIEHGGVAAERLAVVASLAGVITDSGRCAVGDVTPSVPAAPELLRPVV